MEFIDTTNVTAAQDSRKNALAWVSSGFGYYLPPSTPGDGETNELKLTVNMEYYNAINTTDPNGISSTNGSIYLDRTLAHEFTHAVMSANIDWFSGLPLYITEGAAELVHGADDTRNSTLLNMTASDIDKTFNQTTNGSAADAQLPYAVGYAFLRYLAQQSTNGTINETVTKRLTPTPSTSGSEVGVYADFSAITDATTGQPLTGMSLLDGQGFTILCSGCSQYVSFSFDTNLENSDSTFDRKNSNSSNYVIGVKGITSTAELGKYIFDGIAALGERTLSSRQNSWRSNKDIYYVTTTTIGSATSKTSEAVSLVIDGNHDVRISKDPNDPTKYIFSKDSGLTLEFMTAGTILSELTGTETIDLPTSDSNTYTVDSETKKLITEPVYADVEERTPIYQTVYETKPVDEQHGGRGLYIHTGTRPHYTVAVFIENMTADAMGLADANVTTRKKASTALDILDSALEYALNELTEIGSYQSRLEETEQNLVTAAENTQSAESNVRDADVAKAMTSYTKNNILAQSSQSILAQANQKVSDVLGLLS